MLRKGDKVRVIGSCICMDFTKGILEEDDLDDLPLVRLENGKTLCIDSICLFKEDSLSCKLMKLFKRKKYAEYKQTYNGSNEVQK